MHVPSGLNVTALGTSSTPEVPRYCSKLAEDTPKGEPREYVYIRLFLSPVTNMLVPSSLKAISVGWPSRVKLKTEPRCIIADRSMYPTKASPAVVYTAESSMTRRGSSMDMAACRRSSPRVKVMVYGSSKAGASAAEKVMPAVAEPASCMRKPAEFTLLASMAVSNRMVSVPAPSSSRAEESLIAGSPWAVDTGGEMSVQVPGTGVGLNTPLPVTVTSTVCRLLPLSKTLLPVTDMTAS